MNHTHAISIFNEIRARPYRVSTEAGVPANNCYFKGIELLRRLGTMGYAVRGRVCETYWDKNLIPAEIMAMNLPGFDNHLLRHDLAGFWGVTVSRNWRITYRIEDGDVYDVDYVDYH